MKCKCYGIVKSTCLDLETMKMKEDYSGRCLGTKDCETCTCGGDPTKCDFYAEKREGEKKMNTAEMHIEANRPENKENYYYAPGTLFTYNQNMGFKPELDRSVEAFMELIWKRKRAMTRAEAEAKFNIKITD